MTWVLELHDGIGSTAEIDMPIDAGPSDAQIAWAVADGYDMAGADSVYCWVNVRPSGADDYETVEFILFEEGGKIVPYGIGHYDSIVYGFPCCRGRRLDRSDCYRMPFPNEPITVDWF